MAVARWPGSSPKRAELPPFDPTGLPEKDEEAEEEGAEEAESEEEGGAEPPVARWPRAREAESWVMVLLPEEALQMNRAVMGDWRKKPDAVQIAVVGAHLPDVPEGRLRDLVRLALEAGDPVAWEPREMKLYRRGGASSRRAPETWGESVAENTRDD